MADNTTLNSMTGGDVVAAEEISAVKYQLVKLVDSTHESVTGTGTTANPLQVALPAATVTTLTPPAAITGFATSAKQLADGHSVALSATDNAVLDSIQTAVEVIDNAISGTEMQVDVVTLPDAIVVGKTAVDAAIATNPVIIGGRASTATPSDVNADGDVQTLWVDRHGCARVSIHEIGGTAATTGAGEVSAGTQRVTHASDDPVTTAIQLLDNAVDGNYLNVNLNVAGTDVAGGNGTQNAQTLRVTLASDSTGVVNLGATDNAVLDAIALAVAGEAGAVTSGVLIQGDDGTDRTNVLVDTSGHLQVDVLTNVTHAVTVASGGIASGAVASGAIASGAVASGAVASGAIATGAIVDAIADSAGFTVTTSRTFPMGAFADETSPDAVTEHDVACPRMSLTRQLIMTERPSATGESLDIVSNIDIDETEDDIKGSAGKIYGYYIYNNATSTRYLRFYNATAANTTVGTTAALLVIPIPAGAAANCSYEQGIGFSTALCWAATTGVAANDTGAPAASDVVGNVFYK